MDHDKFRFTPNRDNINDLIFLKSLKTPFFILAQWGSFPKKFNMEP